MTNTDWQSYAGESTMSHLSPDVRPGPPAVPLRGGRHGGGRRLHPGHRPAPQDHDRQLLGGHDPLDRADPAPDLVRVRLRVHEPGRHPELPRRQDGDDRRRPGDAQQRATSLQQKVPGGPVASMVPIEALGDNGGGFFNANGAHPYENPNAITSLLLYWLVAMIPFAFPWTFGKVRRVDGPGLGGPRLHGDPVPGLHLRRRPAGGRRQRRSSNRPGSARRRPPPSRAATSRARTCASVWAAPPWARRR